MGGDEADDRAGRLVAGDQEHIRRRVGGDLPVPFLGPEHPPLRRRAEVRPAGPDGRVEHRADRTGVGGRAGADRDRGIGHAREDHSDRPEVIGPRAPARRRATPHRRAPVRT
jgi:hypothetical protein